jgi:uncharacterized protein
MGAPVVRWQIVSPDADRTAAFYSQAFGWTVRTNNAMGYREVASGSDRGIDGGIWPSAPGQAGFAQLFVEVSDIDQAIAKAVELGASVIVPKSVLPDGDGMAVLLDPTGMSVGICQLAPRSSSKG